MTPPDPVADLIEAGDYRGAATLCEERGHFARAQKLLEQLFDYDGASRLAEVQGDTIGALELLLKANNNERAESLRRRLMAELDDEIPRALSLFEGRGYYLQAAELAESIGQFERAAELYIQGSSSGRAGRIFERIGRVRDAGEAYETYLRGKVDDPEANLGLGRVLQRFGRHQEAVPLLCRALEATAVPQRIEAGKRIAYSFFKLRLVEAGRTALERIGLPRSADIESFMLPFEDEFLDVAVAPEGDGGADGGGALEGRYRLEQPAPGLFGSSYTARDLLADRKVLLHFMPGSADDNQDFYDELRRLKDPPCPGHVRILEINPRAGFVALRATDGPTLLDELESRSPPNALRIRGIAIQTFEALMAAHRRGVLHGGLSPAFIGLTAAGVVEVAGWGFRQVERRMATQTAGPESPMVYRSPEATLGRPPDFRADLYSLAAVIFRCLVGEPPTLGGEGAMPGDWPIAFGEFFQRALAANPEARFNSHADFRRDLESLPWSEVSQRRLEPIPVATPTKSTDSGPRFVGSGGALPQPGKIATVQDQLLGREVRYLALPPKDDRPLSLINRLDQLSSPECPSFQDVLLSTDSAIVLEMTGGNTVTERIESVGPIDVETVMDGASSLLAQLAAAHTNGLGLGCVTPDEVIFDGLGFRAPIERVLLVAADHDTTAVVADHHGFWQTIYLALGGHGAVEGTPERVLGLLRAQGHLAPSEFKSLETSVPHGSTSLAGYPTWFEDLRRALDVHAGRQAVFRRMIELAGADRVLTDEEREYLQTRRDALGISDEVKLEP